MANFLKALGEGAWDSIKSPYNVVENLVKGDVGEAWHDLKAIPGNQERANSEIFNAAGIRGWVGDHPGETVAGVVGSVLAAPYVAAGAQGLFGSGGSTGIGASDFASGNIGGNSFGNANFGGNPVSGGTAFKPDTEFGKMAEAYGDLGITPETGDSGLPWADIVKSGFDAASLLGKDAKAVSSSAHRPGFRGAQIPAMQYDTGALQNQMAAKEFQSFGAGDNQLDIPQLKGSKGDLKSLLASMK